MNAIDRQSAGVVTGFAALAAAGALLLGYAAITQPTDAEVRRAAQADYCDAVAQWQDQAARGVPAAQRFGHPDYDHRASTCPPTRYTVGVGEQLAKQ